jgi:O-glycosyl hydrolase
MAARWATPATSTPTYKAMKMYRTYDGNKSTFGDISVAAAPPNPDVAAAFAAERSSDRALTVMVINKDASATTANAINRLPDIGFGGNSFAATLPPQSITLFVLPGGSPVPTAPSNLRVIRD